MRVRLPLGKRTSLLTTGRSASISLTKALRALLLSANKPTFTTKRPALAAGVEGVAATARGVAGATGADCPSAAATSRAAFTAAADRSGVGTVPVFCADGVSGGVLTLVFAALRMGGSAADAAEAAGAAALAGGVAAAALATGAALGAIATGALADGAERVAGTGAEAAVVTAFAGRVLEAAGRVLLAADAGAAAADATGAGAVEADVLAASAALASTARPLATWRASGATLTATGVPAGSGSNPENMEYDCTPIPSTTALQTAMMISLLRVLASLLSWAQASDTVWFLVSAFWTRCRVAR